MADFRLTRGSLLLALLLTSALTPTALGTHCSKAVAFVGPEDRSSSSAVTLRCPGIDTTNYAVFYRCVGTTPSWINPSLAGNCSTGPRPECLDPMRPNVDTVTVEITPEAEGSYYCVVVDRGATSIDCTDGCTGTLADTSFMITAYPMADPDIDGTQFAVWTGSHVRLQCEFPKGQLSAQYTYTWYKDGNQITGTDPTLQIISAGAMDNGIYQCKVSVINTLSVNMLPFERMGRSIELNVYTNVTVQLTDSQVVLEGAQVDFTCVATGIPQPSVQWLFAGQRVDNDDFGRIKVMNTNNGNTVTSVVTISSALSQMHNIPVTCIANQTGTIVALPPAQETANLTVMPNPVTGVVLSLSTVYPQRLFLRFDIPDPFLGMVGMEVTYLVEGNPLKLVPMMDASLDAFFGGVAIMELPREDWLEIKDKEFQVIVKMTSMLDPELTSDASLASNPVFASTMADAVNEKLKNNVHIIVIAGFGVVFIVIALCICGVCGYACIRPIKAVKKCLTKPCRTGGPCYDGSNEDPEPWQADVKIEQIEVWLEALHVEAAWTTWQEKAEKVEVDVWLLKYCAKVVVREFCSCEETTNKKVETDWMVNGQCGANGSRRRSQAHTAIPLEELPPNTTPEPK